MKWTESYQEGDTVIFACGENIDTMIVTSRWLRRADDWKPWDVFNLSKCNWLEISSIYGGREQYEMYVRHNEYTDSAFVDINKVGNDEIEYSLFFFECKILDELLPSDTSKENTDLCLQQVVVGGKTYKDCIVLDSTNCEFINNEYVTRIGLTQVIWNKKIGLLQYKTENGETYTFLEKKSKSAKATKKKNN